jgi:hypothetical protein
MINLSSPLMKVSCYVVVVNSQKLILILVNMEGKSFSLSLCLFVSLSLCLFVSLSLCLSVPRSLSFSLCLSLSPSFPYHHTSLFFMACSRFLVTTDSVSKETGFLFMNHDSASFTLPAFKPVTHTSLFAYIRWLPIALHPGRAAHTSLLANGCRSHPGRAALRR